MKIAINDSINKNSESEGKSSNEIDEYDIENKFEDEIDNGLEYRLDNLKDYINIYSINNNSDKKEEKDNIHIFIFIEWTKTWKIK